MPEIEVPNFGNMRARRGPNEMVGPPWPGRLITSHGTAVSDKICHFCYECLRRQIAEILLRAVLCNGFDGTKALTVGEAPEPHPAPDEVLIDVYAASVSYMDYLMICGGYQMRPALPYVPGTGRRRSMTRSNAIAGRGGRNIGPPPRLL